MMLQTLSAAALMTVVADAQGAFNATGVDFGGVPATNGTPLSVQGGTYLPNGVGSASPSSHALLSPFLGTGGAGTNVVSVASTAPAHKPGSNGTFSTNSVFLFVDGGANDGTNTFTSTSLQGFWTLTIQVPNGTSPGGLNGVWLGRVRISDGATLDLANAEPRVAIREDPMGADVEATVRATFDGTNDDTDASPGALSFMYRIRAYDVDHNFTDGSQVFDLWVEQFVPAPGSVALVACAGAAVLRRRRTR